jgi:hypothetical protein
MVCFSPSSTPTLRSAEANPGRESVCAAHSAGMFAASRCTTNRCARHNRLLATEWMFCFRVEPQQLRRRLCHSWRWGLGHTIRRGWYFVRQLSSFIFSTHDFHCHYSIWFWSVRTLFDPWTHQACVAQLTQYRSERICLGRSERLLRPHRSIFRTGARHPQATRHLSAIFLASSPLSNWSSTSPYVAFGLPRFEPRDV